MPPFGVHSPYNLIVKGVFIMPISFPNQKWIRVHKPRLSNNFLSVANDDWMTANKLLTPYGLQLYLYFAGNADGYQFALSHQHAHDAVGINRTSFYHYLRLMEIRGYLVWRGGSTYDFYTSPRPEKERTHPDKHVREMILFEDDSPCEQPQKSESAQQKENPPCEKPQLLSGSVCSHSNKEIDNRYTNNQTNIETNRGVAAADAAPPPSIAERVITIPPPRSKPQKYVF